MAGSQLRIDPFDVDASERGSKNDAMTKEELQQFAEALRTGRAKLNLNKMEFCKKAGITPNTLRALERGAQHPNPETVNRIARLLGTTAPALTHGKRAIAPNDPLLADLNDEDLEVAQYFHHAPMRVRQRALGVLQERGRRSGKHTVIHDVTELARRLLALPPEKRHIVASLLGQFENDAGEQDQSGLPAVEALPPVGTRRTS